MNSTSTTKHPVIRKEGPCGCIMQVGGDEAPGATTTTPAKCHCVSCGEGCRCVETKGRCDCRERIETAAKEHRPTTSSVEAPVGCAMDAEALHHVEPSEATH